MYFLQEVGSVSPSRNISDTLNCALYATFLFLPQFDVIFDLSLNRRTAIWNLFDNPLTPMSDQNRISPYDINTISTRQVMRIKKNINLGIIS